jgi:phosphoenolpyruvate carboxykinase (ATP)
MPINVTRTVLSAALEGSVSDRGFRTDKNFGFEVPLNVEGINQTLLTPRATWPNASAYDDQAQKLVKMFSDNFEKYKKSVDSSILAVAL